MGVDKSIAHSGASMSARLTTRAQAETYAPRGASRSDRSGFGERVHGPLTEVPLVTGRRRNQRSVRAAFAAEGR
jgi:hypothetical protein